MTDRMPTVAEQEAMWLAQVPLSVLDQIVADIRLASSTPGWSLRPYVRSVIARRVEAWHKEGK